MFRHLPSICFLLVFIVQFGFSGTRSAHSQQWRTLKTGAGGWMTGLDIHSSGSPVFARSDVGSAYRWSEGEQKWKNIVTADSMPVDDVHWSKHLGVLSIVSAPADSAVAYMAYLDGIFRSGDAADTWTRTAIRRMEMRPNDDTSKLAGERLAVDPINSDIVFFGSINDGLWRTEDGGDNWLNIESVSSGTKDRGVRQVVFDPTSQTTSGRTSHVYAMVDGTGVFESHDAGKTWRLNEMGVEQPLFFDAEISASGKLYVCGTGSTGKSFGVRRFDGAKWVEAFNTGNRAIGEIALDPHNVKRAILMTEGFSDTYRTTNLDANQPEWTHVTHDRQARGIPWMGWTSSGWFTLGEVVFDPVVENRLWIAEGTGVWRTSDLNDETITWEETSVGQEHLVSNDAIALPEGRALTAHWDRPIFLHENPDEFPATHLPSVRFNSAWDLDMNPADPEFIVAIVEDHRYCCYDEGHRNSGFSEDGGKTWTPFATHPTSRGKESIHGRLAVSAGNRDNIVWLPAWNAMPYFTMDRGRSWTQAELPGNSGNCCIASPWQPREALVADRVLENTFYIFDWADGHVFQSDNGGRTWNRFDAVLPKWAYNGQLKSVPGHAGHLYYARGKEDAVRLIHGAMRSRDGGKSWEMLPGTNEVLGIAIGMAAPNKSYPTIYIQGRVDDDFGFFKSTDEGTTWEKIGKYPLGIYDYAKAMEGDMFRYNRLLVGYGGNGFVVFDGAAAANDSK